MNRFLRLRSAFLLLLLTPDFVSAATIFESGTLGPTGITWTDLTNGTVPGTNVNYFVFPGVRFELTQPAHTSAVGGHFGTFASGTFFGAIVALDNQDDFPNSFDLSTADVLGAAQLTFPNPSAEVFGSLELRLDPGWYALVFGSGLFGTGGSGVAPRNGSDIGNPSYIGFGPNLKWFNLDTLPGNFDNHRFVVRGEVIPEPDSIVLVLVVMAATALGSVATRQ